MSPLPECRVSAAAREAEECRIMLDQVAGLMRCPHCLDHPLRFAGAAASCRRCGARYPHEGGILDMMPGDASEIITPFQRLMQAPPVVGIYERFWRPLGYFIASSRSFDAEVATILRFHSERQETRVLDLACGTGVFTRPLARSLNGPVIGLDLSMPMLRQARRLANRDGLKNVVLIRGTAFRIPFIAGAFRQINCCGALHLFDSPDPALVEIARVLGDGGRLTVQTTIRPRRSAGLAFLLERFIRFGFFGEDDLREMMRRRGFKILESERHRISFTFLARPAGMPR